MADSRQFVCTVVTPEKVVLERDVRFVAVPAHDGEIGFMAGRAPIVVKLDVGQLRVETSSDFEELFIDGGFAEMVHNRLTILTEDGKRPLANFNVAFCYDFLYNEMTAEQCKLAYSVLTLGNYDNNQYGCFQDPVSSTSNWTTFSYRIFSWLPLDGDGPAAAGADEPGHAQDLALSQPERDVLHGAVARQARRAGR